MLAEEIGGQGVSMYEDCRQEMTGHDLFGSAPLGFRGSQREDLLHLIGKRKVRGCCDPSRRAAGDPDRPADLIQRFRTETTADLAVFA